MKAYNCKCNGCGHELDRIYKDNEVIKCSKCDQVMARVGGPIGGSNILPLHLGKPDRFVSFHSDSLGRKIETENDLTLAYEEMYGVKSFISVKIDSTEESEEEVSKPKRGRPKKITIEDDEEDKEDAA